ncbi:hypothetical protein Tco_0189973 [Tanacetum coccineum]
MNSIWVDHSRSLHYQKNVNASSRRNHLRSDNQHLDVPVVEEERWRQLRSPDSSFSKYLGGALSAMLEGVVVVAVKAGALGWSSWNVTSLSSLFNELPPDQLDVDWNNLTPMTFVGLHTSPFGQILQAELEVELALPNLLRVGGIVVVVVVVVVIIEVVAVDVGSGESDCIVMRSITRVVIGGTEEVS